MGRREDLKNKINVLYCSWIENTLTNIDITNIFLSRYISYVKMYEILIHYLQKAKTYIYCKPILCLAYCDYFL